MGNLLQDIRFAFRQFRQSPGFVLAAILSLTLGIGATTAIFSVVYAILFYPYPYRDANRMVHVELRDKSGQGPLLFVNGTEYPQLRAASSIDDVFLQLTGSHLRDDASDDRADSPDESHQGFRSEIREGRIWIEA